MYDNIQSKTTRPYTYHRVGSKGQNIFVPSKNGRVAYQIKENVTYNNMQAIILLLHAHSTQTIFLKVVMLHIKLKGKERVMCYKISKYFALTHILTPWKGFKVQTSFSSEGSDVAYQMNRNVGHAHTMIIYTMDGFGGLGEVSFNPAWDSCIA